MLTKIPDTGLTATTTTDMSDTDSEGELSDSLPPSSRSSSAPSTSSVTYLGSGISLDADNRCHVLDDNDLLAVWALGVDIDSDEGDDEVFLPSPPPPPSTTTKSRPIAMPAKNLPPISSPPSSAPLQLPASWQPAAARRANDKSYTSLARAVDRGFPFDAAQVVTHEVVGGGRAYTAHVESTVIHRNRQNYVESVQRQLTRLFDSPDGQTALSKPIERIDLNYSTRNGAKPVADVETSPDTSGEDFVAPPLLYSAATLVDVDEAMMSQQQQSTGHTNSGNNTEARFPTTMTSSWSTGNSMEAICGGGDHTNVINNSSNPAASIAEPPSFVATRPNDPTTNQLYAQLASMLLQAMPQPQAKSHQLPSNTVPVYQEWEAALDAGLTNPSRRSPVASTPPPKTCAPMDRPMQQQQQQLRPMRAIVGTRHRMANITNSYNNQQQQQHTTPPPPGYHQNHIGNYANNYNSINTSVAPPTMLNGVQMSVEQLKEAWQLLQSHPFMQRKTTTIPQKAMYSAPPPKMSSFNGGYNIHNDYAANKENDAAPMMGCTFCKKNGETPQVYMSHQLNGLQSCPVLRDCLCSQCGNRGHTAGHCTNRTPSILKLMTKFGGANF